MWAGKDKPTNVLSFPSGTFDGNADQTLGDIILAFETVAAEAAQMDIPVTHHASHLVIHGMLHLLGYDHGSNEEAEKMEGLETEILGAMGLHDPYGADSELVEP
jgi:probable rRNA maturation factor